MSQSSTAEKSRLIREIDRMQKEHKRLGRELKRPGHALAAAAWRIDLTREIAEAEARLKVLCQ